MGIFFDLMFGLLLPEGFDYSTLDLGSVEDLCIARGSSGMMIYHRKSAFEIFHARHEEEGILYLQVDEKNRDRYLCCKDHVRSAEERSWLLNTWSREKILSLPSMRVHTLNNDGEDIDEDRYLIPVFSNSDFLPAFQNVAKILTEQNITVKYGWYGRVSDTYFGH